MKILGVRFEGLPHFKEPLDINFVAQQRVDEEDKGQLCHVFSNIYVNKVLSFIGINASGKTTILKALSFEINLLNNTPINSIDSREILTDLKENQTVTITVFFYKDFLINKLITTIVKKVNEVDGSEKFIITDEKLWSKEIKKVRTKKSLFEFEEKDLKVKRDQKEQYLSDDISIIIAENKNNHSDSFLFDMSSLTNHNMLNVLGRFPEELLTFLDPSIEYLKCKLSGKKADIQLKFHNKKEISLNNPRALENYLSSGTIKGLSVFMSAVFTFCEGGYLILDEIENHFNEEIVFTLVRFFMDKKVNKKGGVLVFSTHYSELLDEFDRNDGIYIVRNRGGITAENLANILKRNDIKKSEAYDSGFLEGTVPVYEAYIALKKVLTSIEIQED